MTILLATLNAKYIHASLGLRYLAANMGDLRERTQVSEFVIAQRPADIVEALLAHEPTIIGLGVYIWNAVETLAVVRLLKTVAPHIKVVLGGPEVSHETAAQEIVQLADHTITAHENYRRRAAAAGRYCAAVRRVQRRRYRQPLAVCRSIPRLPIQVRVLLKLARQNRLGI
jgi:hypothetical protein